MWNVLALDLAGVVAEAVLLADLAVGAVELELGVDCPSLPWIYSSVEILRELTAAVWVSSFTAGKFAATHE